MNFLSLYILIFSLIFIYMSFWFFLSLIKKRNDVADIAWGIGFLFISIISLFLSNFYFINIIVFILVLLWSIRLSLYIYIRNKNKKEDYRYKEMSNSWGKYFYIMSFLQVFLLQGLLMIIVSTPIIINVFHNKVFNIYLFMIGLFLWIVGFLFETISDIQLFNFMKDKNNRGKILKSGLWKYSRHPNYFGEVTLWWGIFFISFYYPYQLIGIIGPLTITFLILKVSGIPLLEKKFENIEEFKEYKKKTSVFFPMPVKKI